MSTTTYIKNTMPNSLVLKLGNAYVNFKPGEARPLASVLVSDIASSDYNADQIEALVKKGILAKIDV